MKKIYHQVVLLAVFVTVLSSCKLDPPVLPSGVNSTNGGTGGVTGPETDPVNTIGLPIGATGTVKAQVGSATGVQTYDQVNFNALLGTNSITGILNTDVINIGYVGEKTGTFDLPILNIGDYTIPDGQVGKIEITVSTMNDYSEGIIKGGFEAEVVNSSGVKLLARGSFNIKQ
ncbi:MAG: hypothetical protein JKY70_20055 [Mucilaginibacter sp.]|nr:hypothetical protein [Mucilaginibacter sp.]